MINASSHSDQINLGNYTFAIFKTLEKEVLLKDIYLLYLSF